jgi:hypothetical protein
LYLPNKEELRQLLNNQLTDLNMNQIEEKKKKSNQKLSKRNKK